MCIRASCLELRVWSLGQRGSLRSHQASGGESLPSNSRCSDPGPTPATTEGTTVRVTGVHEMAQGPNEWSAGKCRIGKLTMVMCFMQIQLFPVALQIVCHWQSQSMPIPLHRHGEAYAFVARFATQWVEGVVKGWVRNAVCPKLPLKRCACINEVAIHGGRQLRFRESRGQRSRTLKKSFQTL